MNLAQIKSIDKTKLLNDPPRHLQVLRDFREIVKEHILGVEDPEYRAEVEFLLSRTEEKIKQVLHVVQYQNFLHGKAEIRDDD